jgi:rRNA maturation protein Nop10
MELRLCRECHRLVSEEAKTCPRCGVPRPVASEDETAWLVKHRGALLLALLLFGLEIAWFRAQVKQLAGPPIPMRVAPVDSYPGYRSLAQEVWVGARLYDRQDWHYVGQITSLNCPDPTPRGSIWRCVEVEFVDGHRDWVRRQVGETRYIAQLPH